MCHRTPSNLVSVHCARPATGVTSVRRDKDIPAGQTLPTPDDARPIVCRLMGLPVVTEPGRESRVSGGTALDHCATREALDIDIFGSETRLLRGEKKLTQMYSSVGKYRWTV